MHSWEAGKDPLSALSVLSCSMMMEDFRVWLAKADGIQERPNGSLRHQRPAPCSRIAKERHSTEAINNVCGDLNRGFSTPAAHPALVMVPSSRQSAATFRHSRHCWDQPPARGCRQRLQHLSAGAAWGKQAKHCKQQRPPETWPKPPTTIYAHERGICSEYRRYTAQLVAGAAALFDCF